MDPVMDSKEQPIARSNLTLLRLLEQIRSCQYPNGGPNICLVAALTIP